MVLLTYGSDSFVLIAQKGYSDLADFILDPTEPMVRSVLYSPDVVFQGLEKWSVCQKYGLKDAVILKYQDKVMGLLLLDQTLNPDHVAWVKGVHSLLSLHVHVILQA